MPEPTVVQLLARIDAQIDVLTRDLDHLEKTIRGLADQRRTLEARIAELTVTKTITASIGKSILDEDAITEGSGSPYKLTIADAAEGALRELGGEADLRTLVLMLTEKGVLQGRERRATLSTQLIRNRQRFHKVGVARWAIGPEPNSVRSAPPISDVMPRLAARSYPAAQGPSRPNLLDSPESSRQEALGPQH
jgi:hypothetical protein